MKGNIFIFKMRLRNIIVMKVRQTLLFRPIPVNTKHVYSIYALLVQRQRRWADVV